MIWLLANIHFDDGLLTPWLKYYRALGVERFGIIYHGDYKLIPQDDIVVEDNSEPYHSGPRDNELLMEFRAKYLSPKDWYIPADLDEFHWTPGLSAFSKLTGDWDYVPSKFVDRISQDGKIHELTRESLDSQFPLAARVLGKICNGCEDKVALCRGDKETNSGHHGVPGIKAPFTIQTHHFKWQGRNFWNFMKSREDMKIDSTQREMPPFRCHYRNNGCINVYDPMVEVYKSPPIGI